ncbi:DUF5996 family protein [Legionella sp. D16C41]|uniref:DUF5996 family protein n=1 Tax=Legionella sp. D16C41 TaxID=3402688 RepID=UPI003AF59C79
MELLAHYEPWPTLPYKDFASTSHLLHMGMQAIGKLKLVTPFEPQWANVAFSITSRGLTTGPIPYQTGIFTVDLDFIEHKVSCSTSWQTMGEFQLRAMSVAEFTHALFELLSQVGIAIPINLRPQEVVNPIPFDEDTQEQSYDSKLANAWWRILVSSYRVMQQYHARFNGKTPPIGFMWGTFDLRDARYQGTMVPTTGINSGYIRRNAMNEAQVECGWWSGNENYPKPAYYSFIYPEPPGIEQSKIKPTAARWDNTMRLFILDYDDIRTSKTPETDLLMFLESTYQASSELAGWDKKLISLGQPI